MSHVTIGLGLLVENVFFKMFPSGHLVFFSFSAKRTIGFMRDLGDGYLGILMLIFSSDTQIYTPNPKMTTL